MDGGLFPVAEETSRPVAKPLSACAAFMDCRTCGTELSQSHSVYVDEGGDFTDHVEKNIIYQTSSVIGIFTFEILCINCFIQPKILYLVLRIDLYFCEPFFPLM